MSEVSNTDGNFVRNGFSPSKTMSNWFVGLGSLGIFLAVLNLLGRFILTIEYLGVECLRNHQQSIRRSFNFAFVVVSDIIFIAHWNTCGLGFKSINGQEGGIGNWFKSFVNETWMSLADPDVGGWFKTMGAGVYYWVLSTTFISVGNNWLDRPGVYSVTIGLSF